jgi:hypothetical protein
MPTITEEQREQSRAYAMTKPKSICQCGHTGDGEGSQHSSSGVWSAGHGACVVPGCSCLRFRWERFREAYRTTMGLR